MPKTKTCESCGHTFEYVRASARFCSSACRVKAHRTQHGKPVTIERLEASQRRSDRPHDRHVQRPQQLGGGPVGLLSDLAVRRDGRRGIVYVGASSVEREVFQRLDESPGESWARVLSEAAIEFGQVIVPAWRAPEFRHVDPAVAASVWRRKYLTHPELTREGRLEIVRVVPEQYNAVRRRARVDAIAEEIRGLRRDMQEGFAAIEARLAEISRANPEDRDFERAVAELLEEAGAA